MEKYIVIENITNGNWEKNLEQLDVYNGTCTCI